MFRKTDFTFLPCPTSSYRLPDPLEDERERAGFPVPDRFARLRERRGDGSLMMRRTAATRSSLSPSSLPISSGVGTGFVMTVGSIGLSIAPNRYQAWAAFWRSAEKVMPSLVAAC